MQKLERELTGVKLDLEKAQRQGEERARSAKMDLGRLESEMAAKSQVVEYDMVEYEHGKCVCVLYC